MLIVIIIIEANQVLIVSFFMLVVVKISLVGSTDELKSLFVRKLLVHLGVVDVLINIVREFHIVKVWSSLRVIRNRVSMEIMEARSLLSDGL